MVTILDKDITRESTLKHDNREIQVTLTETQKVSMKLKGMKSGTVDITIDELYRQLSGYIDPIKELANRYVPTGPVTIENKDEDEVKTDKKGKNVNNNNSPMINLYDLRSLSAVTVMPYETKVLFERIISDLIKSEKEKVKPKN